jgi:hypothetical protein
VTSLEIIGLFVGIPLGLAAVIALFVMASGWREAAKSPQPLDGPLFVVSDSPTPDPGRLPREIASGAEHWGGGARGSW